MESIERLEDMGYAIKEVNNKLVFNYESGTITDLMEVEKIIKEIQSEENKVIDFLHEREKRENHKLAISLGYSPYKYNECYGKQLTNNSFIFIQKIDNSKIWTSYRITYNDFLQSTSDKTIIESPNLEESLKRSEIYIKNYMKYLKG